MPGARAPGLHPIDDVPILVAKRCLPVGAGGIGEVDAAEDRIQVRLLLRYLPQGSDAGDEPRLNFGMRGQSGKPLHVAAGEVHEDGLGDVVQIVARGERLYAQRPGRLVHAPPTEHPAVGAWRSRSKMSGYLVHVHADLVAEADDHVLHVEGAAQRADLLYRGGAVTGDALVHGYAAEADIPPLLGDVPHDGKRHAGILASGHRHRDVPRFIEVDLGAQLLLHPALHELLEVLGA